MQKLCRHTPSLSPEPHHRKTSRGSLAHSHGALGRFFRAVIKKVVYWSEAVDDESNEKGAGGSSMKCNSAIARSFFFALLLVLFSINISYADYLILSGYITDTNSGAHEWHVVARETSDANLGNDIRTNTFNHYDMALFPGNYDVYCESNINVNDCDVVLSSPVQPIEYFPTNTTTLNFSIPQLVPAHITGSVKNDQGTGIPSVIVSASSYDGTCTSSSESSADGSFDLTVIPGTYILFFSAPETTTPNTTAYVNKGIAGVAVTGTTELPDTTLNSLLTYLLNGYFNDGNGNHTLGEFDSATINADNTSIISSLWTTTTNDSFIFNLFTGSYTITAVLYDYYGNSQTSTTYQEFDYPQPPNPNTLEITLPTYDYYFLEGTVTDDQGIALPDVNIDALEHDGMCRGNARTDSNGNYVLRLIPGQYVVTVTAPPSPATYPPFLINNIDISGDCQRNIRLFSDDTILKDAIDLLNGNLDIALDVFDIIKQGNTLSYDIEVTGARNLLEIIFNWAGSGISVEIFNPAGNSIALPYQSPTKITIQYPSPGTWTCVITTVNVPYNPVALVAGVTRIYVLNASVSGGHGTVLPASGTYNQGFVVSLTATPDSGYRVKAWYGTDNDFSKSTANSVTMIDNLTVTVEFELIPTPPVTTTYTLNASVSNGNGTIQPGSGTYSQGTVVSLSATPGSGYQVKAWHGTNNDSSKSTGNSVTMNANRIVTVEFELIPAPPASTTYTLNASVVNGHGAVTVSPSSGPYSQGTTVSLSAAPENGYKVKAWTGTDDDASTAVSNTVTMNAERIVTVEFVPITNPADTEGKGGGGGGGCYISTCAAAPLPLSMIPLIILFGIVFIGLSFPNRLVRNSLYNEFFKK